MKLFQAARFMAIHWLSALWMLQVFVVPQASAETIPDSLVGEFTVSGEVAGPLEQQPGWGDTLLMRWPSFIDGESKVVEMNYKQAGHAGRFRNVEEPDKYEDRSWALYRDGVLSSYRLRLQNGGGFWLEVLHRQVVADGLELRWTLLRDGEIVARGAESAVRRQNAVPGS